MNRFVLNLEDIELVPHPEIKLIQKENVEQVSELGIIRKDLDFKIRKYLLELIGYKKQINEELKNENLSSIREMQLKEALEIIDNNIQKVRFEGIL